MSEYTEQVDNFLKENGITFTSVLIGSDCPMFCEDKKKGIDLDKINTYPRKTHIHGKHYLCTFKRYTQDGDEKAILSVDFWNSYNDEEFNWLKANKFSSSIPDRLFLQHGMKRGVYSGNWVLPLKLKNQRPNPDAYSVLASLQKYEIGSFEDFCGEFGYDTDSRKAETVYHAVQDEWGKVRKFFTKAEIEKLREIS